jgi:hypothetical protein
MTNDMEEVVNSGMLKNDDIIIIMMSFPYRDDNGPIYNFNKMEKLLKPYVHFYVNSFYPTFLNEDDYDITLLPTYFINPSGSITDYLTDYEIENDASIWEYGWRHRKDKPKFSFDSYHPNLEGYKLVADYLYNEIKDVYIEMIDNNKINNRNIKIV